MSTFRFSSPHVLFDDKGTVTALANRFGNEVVGWTASTDAWADAVEPEILDLLRHNAPAKTGKLRDSLAAHRTVIPGVRVRLEFRAGVAYYPYVVKGTRPHVIRPKTAQVLHWHDSGGEHFAKFVHHPGTKANDFPRRTLHELRALIVSSYIARLRKAYLP